MPSPQLDRLSSLPNELLDLILSNLSTQSLLNLTTVSRHLHHHALLTFHNRLISAAALDSHTLILECYHPSAKLVASHLYCTYQGTPGLLPSPLETHASPVGQLSHLCGLYSRFLPQRKQPENVVSYRRKHPAGDVLGSRTYPSTQPRQQEGVRASGLLVAEAVSLDAHELFSQLCCVTNLVKLVPGRRGLFSSIVEVSDGMIRVWRDWLGRRAGVVEGVDKGLGEDEGILWVNNCDEAVGIKFRVKERKFRTDNPILYADDEEVAVSYYIEFEELLIKTTYVLDKIEKSREQQKGELGTGKAIIFGSAFVS